MLYLISLGLFDEKDISVRALEAGKKCQKLYVEFYTSGMNISVKKLSKVFGKKVEKVERADLENRAGEMIKEAKRGDVGVLVGGDALAATTHISLLMDARKAGVKVEVVHGSSIFTAMAETGLQLYKFGRAVTLAFEKCLTCYSAIEQNLKAGLHTLVLLDIPMSARDGLNTLLELERIGEKGLLKPGTKIIAAVGLGGPEQAIRYGKIKELLKARELNRTPAVLVVPGKLHFLEKEYLESLEALF